MEWVRVCARGGEVETAARSGAGIGERPKPLPPLAAAHHVDVRHGHVLDAFDLHVPGEVVTLPDDIEVGLGPARLRVCQDGDVALPVDRGLEDELELGRGHAQGERQERERFEEVGASHGDNKLGMNGCLNGVCPGFCAPAAGFARLPGFWQE